MSIHKNEHGIEKPKPYQFHKPGFEIIPDSQKRVFGIIHEQSNVKDQDGYTTLAYLAHNGIDWKNTKIEKMQDNAYQQLYGGRGIEVLVCEALIQGKAPGFHFLPTKEFDLQYKIDLISRVPYYTKTNGGTSKKLRTLSIGSQLTLLEIPENIVGRKREENERRHRFSDKQQQTRLMGEYLHIPLTRKELKDRFGKLTLPDIICFIGINGELRKTFGNSSGYMRMKYEEWRKQGFKEERLANLFKERIKLLIDSISNFIAWSQKYVFEDFFLNCKNYNRNRIDGVDDKEFNVDIKYTASEQKIDFLLNSEDGMHILCKITYFFHDDDLRKMTQKAKIHADISRNKVNGILV